MSNMLESKLAKEQNREEAFWWSKTNYFKRSIFNANYKSFSKTKDYNLKYFELETIEDFNRYTDKAVSWYKLGEVTENASKYYRQAIKAINFLNIKVNFNRIIYDVDQMNFEVFQIVVAYNKIIRN